MKNNYTQGEGKDGNNPHSRDAYAACRIKKKKKRFTY